MTRRPAAVLVLLLAAAACSNGGGDEAATTTTEPLVTTTTAPPPPALLTGLPISDRANLDRPALVVKIDNAPQARPQSGVDKADVVYEEVVEGGVVRFMAVFQSQNSALVGPVRSVRPVDPDIVSPLKGLFAYAGGAPQFEKLIQKAPVRLVGINQLEKAYDRRSGKRSPHNLYSSTVELYKGAKSSDGPPPSLFTYATSAPTGTPAVHATVVMGGLTTGAWDWDPSLSRWKRSTNGTAHVMEDGPQLSFANVIVQYVRYSNTTSRDVAGFPVPTATVVGSGDAVVLAGGTQVRTRWTKRSVTDVTAFTDATGVPIQLLPGPTWVMLAPLGASTTLR
jgi:Protein of unknown function (DUF3048) N-terminal domain/Protein of unknown function (DUF3048) C-terminal domain